jgi:predicted nuclease with TOPRIM domain
LRLANECLELNQDGKVNVMLRTEIDYLKDQMCQ